MLGAVPMKLSLQSNKVAAACIYIAENFCKCYERGRAGLHLWGFGFGGVGTIKQDCLKVV